MVANKKNNLNLNLKIRFCRIYKVLHNVIHSKLLKTRSVNVTPKNSINTVNYSIRFSRMCVDFTFISTRQLKCAKYHENYNSANLFKMENKQFVTLYRHLFITC